MKKVLSLSIIFCFVLVLFACTGTPLTPETDRQFLTAPEAFRWQDCASGFLETPWGEYQNVSDMEKDLVYFSPAGEHTFYVLCGKPDCAHNDENCSAYGGLAIGYFDETLYYIRLNSDCEYVISKMRMDGTAHSDIALLPTIENKISGVQEGGGEYFFHNGYLYMDCVDRINESIPRSILFRIDVTTGETERLFDSFFDAWRIASVSLIGDKVYIKVLNRATADITPPAERESICALAAGDMNTGEIGILFPSWPYFGGMLPVEKDGVLYYHRPGVGYCEYDLSAKKERVRLSADLCVSQVSYGERYIFARELENDALSENEWGSSYAPWKFSVYDYHYNVVASLPFEDYVLKPSFLFAADDCLYFSDRSDYRITHYADVNAIGTDAFSLIPVAAP